MKSFNQFIGESEGDWANWRLGNILSDEQCQFIEEHVGENPEFISNQDQPEDFKILDSITTNHKETVKGRWSWISRYSPIDGLNIIFIQESGQEEDFFFAINKSDFERLQHDGLDSWKIEGLFNDF